MTVNKETYINTLVDSMSMKDLQQYVANDMASFLYYVNDADGDTILYNYRSKNIKDIPNYEDIKIIKKVTPKQGRVLVFDGMTWHTAQQPTKGPRCVINFDMV